MNCWEGKNVIPSLDYSDCKCLSAWGRNIHTKLIFLLNVILIHVSLGNDYLNVSSGYLHSVSLTNVSLLWLHMTMLENFYNEYWLLPNHTCQTTFFSFSFSFPLRYKCCFPDVRHKAILVSLMWNIMENKFLVCRHTVIYKTQSFFLVCLAHLLKLT